MSLENGKTENGKVQKTLSFAELDSNLKIEESKYPFHNWDKETNADLICEIHSIAGKNFTCRAYNRKTKKTENMKLAIMSVLEKQFAKFELEECLIAGQTPKVHILYLGKKESNKTEYEYHNFVCEYFNETTQTFQTTNKYLNWLEETSKAP